ncbi:DDE-type integrase/transposase/recombinase [Cyanobium sp. Candia 9D4]|nr:DDE-type integrase/transposase/recombinase [Cyanobium sp. Candia 9D4]
MQWICSNDLNIHKPKFLRDLMQKAEILDAQVWSVQVVPADNGLWGLQVCGATQQRQTSRPMPTHPTRPQSAGAPLLRWANGPCGSTQQQQQALEFMQQSPSLRRIARLATGTNQHPGQGDAEPWAELPEDPRPQLLEQQTKPAGAARRLNHFDINQQARFHRDGVRIAGDRTVGFLSHAASWFTGHGTECPWLRSDNGSACQWHGWRNACHALAFKFNRTRPYTLPSKGKVERFFEPELLRGCGLCWRSGLV